MLVMSAMSVLAADQYPINYPKDTKINDTKGRYINNIVLTSPADGMQEAPVNQKNDYLLYYDITDLCFAAVPGETVIPSFDWNGGWMHGYVYLDRDNDGEFSHELGENSAIPEGSDVMAFTSCGGYSSAGVEAAGNVGVYPPSFKMPDLAPGLYRMRYKIDWNSIDPGGNTADGQYHGQLITDNAGGIVDIMVYLHERASGVDVVSEHGNVCDFDGVDICEAGITPGEDLSIQIVPDAGYRVKGLTVESGYELNRDDVRFALSDLNRASNVIPPYLIVNNTVTIPAAYTYGDVKLIVEYAEGGADEGEDYACSLSGTKKQSEGFMKVTIGSGVNTSSALVYSTKRHYFYEKTVLHAVKSETIVPAVDYKGDATTVNFYIDLNQDGIFSADMGELLSTAASTEALPSFTLPTTVGTGVYRTRIEAEGVAAVDFLLNLHNTYGTVKVDVLNGFVTGVNGGSIPSSIIYGGNTLVVTPQATLPGFEAEKIVVRHGHNLNGLQYMRGNRQWDEIEVPVGTATQIASANIDGDILVKGNFEPTADCEWQAVWSDEFNGKKLDTQKWSYHPRYSSAWNRFIAQGNECQVVNQIGDGQYQAWCIPTPDEFKPAEKQPMISGAIYTAGKFYCTGGWIEARIKTTPHIGNFPAFWMMPVNQLTWPNSGEIDIWEQINNENLAYHTIHSAWGNQTMGKPDTASPAKGGTGTCIASQWHVYALEWDHESLKFYVDGKLNFTYNNMHYSDSKYTEELAWPFSKPFYIICNQSVGNGSWAANPDTEFSYHTEFDYVRVYQKKDALDYYSTADGFVSGIEDVVIGDSTESDHNASVEYYNIQGIRVSADNLVPGIYIRKQGNKTTKLMVK